MYRCNAEALRAVGNVFNKSKMIIIRVWGLIEFDTNNFF